MSQLRTQWSIETADGYLGVKSTDDVVRSVENCGTPHLPVTHEHTKAFVAKQILKLLNECESPVGWNYIYDSLFIPDNSVVKETPIHFAFLAMSELVKAGHVRQFIDYHPCMTVIYYEIPLLNKLAAIK